MHVENAQECGNMAEGGEIAAVNVIWMISVQDLQEGIMSPFYLLGGDCKNTHSPHYTVRRDSDIFRPCWTHAILAPPSQNLPFMNTLVANQNIIFAVLGTIKPSIKFILIISRVDILQRWAQPE